MGEHHSSKGKTTTPKITLVHPSQWLSAASLSRASRSSSAPSNSAALLLSSASSPTTSPRWPITAFPSAYTSRPLRAFPAQQCFTPSLLSSWSAASAALHSSLLWAWSSISHSVELSHTLPGLTDMPLMDHALDSSEPPTETDTPTWTTMSLEVMAVLPSCQARELLADSRRLLSPSQLSDASSSSSPSSSNSSSSSTVARSAPLVHPQTTGTPPALPSASSGNASQRTGLMPTRMPIRSQHTLPRLTCARATLLIRLLLVVSRQSTSMVMRPRMECACEQWVSDYHDYERPGCGWEWSEP